MGLTRITWRPNILGHFRDILHHISPLSSTRQKANWACHPGGAHKDETNVFNSFSAEKHKYHFRFQENIKIRWSWSNPKPLSICQSKSLRCKRSFRLPLPWPLSLVSIPLLHLSSPKPHSQNPHPRSVETRSHFKLALNSLRLSP